MDRKRKINEKRIAKKLKRYWPLYVMLLPGSLYLIINNYLPMTGIVVAFKQFNYQNGIFIILGTVIAIAVAILLGELTSERGKKVYQTCLLIPFIIAIVVVSYIVCGSFSQNTVLLIS